MLIGTAPGGRATIGWLPAAGFVLAVSACSTAGPPPPVAGPFDGVWTSPQLGYDFQVDGPVGRAVQSSRTAVHTKEEVFRMTALDDTMRFSGTQLMPDGTWHEFAGELKPDGKIYCRDGHSTWVLERK